MLQFMESQRAEQDLVTEQQQQYYYLKLFTGTTTKNQEIQVKICFCQWSLYESSKITFFFLKLRCLGQTISIFCVCCVWRV